MSIKQTTTSDSSTRHTSPKQIAALICVALLVLLYLVTLLAACLDFSGSGKLFQSCLVATIGLPILLWIYIWVYGVYRDKHTIASLDILKEDNQKK